MDKFLETIMNFINENTTLLIIICVFLIFVLIGYLIDNSIKTRKLEKQMLNDDMPNYNEEPINESVVEEAKPTIDPNTEINLDFRTPEEKEADEQVELPSVKPVIEEEKPAIDPNTEINLDFRTPEEIEADNKQNAPIVEEIKPIEPTINEVTVDPAINDLLLRDFSNKVNDTVEDSSTDEVSINPIENIVSINNDIEKEEPKEESVYKNDKKLSDIFKKKTVEEKPSLEKTSDYTNELDKILKKLNEVDSKDSTLDETQDFTNMF